MARTLVAYTEGKACRTFSASGIGLADRKEKKGNPAGIFLWRRADRAWSGLVPPVAHNVAVPCDEADAVVLIAPDCAVDP